MNKGENLKNILRALIILSVICVISFSVAVEQEEQKPFEVCVFPTRQDYKMDWWFAVPSQFPPKVTIAGEIFRGEKCNIFLTFSNYGVESNAADITFDLKVIKSDGTLDACIEDCEGYKGEIPGKYFLPSQNSIYVCFDKDDPLGEYTVEVTARDHIKNQTASKTTHFCVSEFKIPSVDPKDSRWFLNYPSEPKPAVAFAHFLNRPRPYINEKGTILWSSIWFYKYVFEENEFLIPHLITFFENQASEQQKKDIILLLFLIGKTESLPKLTDNLEEYKKSLRDIVIPDPYAEITTGSQEDMLWAEFFATSRVKPVKHLITALNLSKHAEVLDKIKKKEITEINDEIREKAMLGAVFHAALWSLSSNCMNCDLLLQYCIGIYESNELNEIEKGYLGVVLKKVFKEKKEKESVNKPDTAK
ncbi:hypothetical protein M0R36_03480 [bacterium]|jgi:hypothetical protein|nr:hypothetical protein [bacterium]